MSDGTTAENHLENALDELQWCRKEIKYAQTESGDVLTRRVERIREGLDVVDEYLEGVEQRAE